MIGSGWRIVMVAGVDDPPTNAPLVGAAEAGCGREPLAGWAPHDRAVRARRRRIPGRPMNADVCARIAGYPRLGRDRCHRLGVLHGTAGAVASCYTAGGCQRWCAMTQPDALGQMRSAGSHDDEFDLGVLLSTASANSGSSARCRGSAAPCSAGGGCGTGAPS